MKKIFTTFAAALVVIMATPHSATASTAAIPANITGIHSIGTVTGQSVTVKALVKGKSATDPFRLRLIPIQKQIIGSWLRAGGSAILRRSPYWIAAMAAIGYIVDDTGNISSSNPSIYGHCNSGKNNNTLSLCIEATNREYGRTDSYVDPFIHEAFGCPQGYNQMQFIGFNRADGVFQPSTRFCFNSQPVNTPVSDADFIDAAIQHMAANPSVDALTDPDKPGLWGHIEPQGLTYIPQAENGQDELWVQNVLDGIAQSTDAAAPGYVPADQLARIEALAQQIAAGQTAEGVVDAANAAATAPLTPAALAEMEAAERAAEQAAAQTAETAAESAKDEAASDIDEKFDFQLENLEPPGLPTLFSMPRIDSTSCLSVSLTWMGNNLEFPGRYCDKIEQGKSILGYVLFFVAMYNIALAVLREVN